MPTNIEFQAQLNALLQEQNKIMEESAKLTKSQTTLVRDLVTALRNADFRDVVRNIEDTKKAVQDTSSATKELGGTNQDVFQKINKSLEEALKKEEETGHGIDNLAGKMKKFAVASSAIDGFVQGLRMTYNSMHNIISLSTGLIGSLSHIGAAIVSIPFKMLSGLLNMAGSGSGDTSLREALESIRKEFGALKETSGRAIIDMAKNMKGELANTGLSVYRIFGNLAEKLRFMQEYAHNLGPLFANLAKQFVLNAEAVGAYYKGLGLTEEAQKAVAERAYALGTGVTEELRQIANYSLQLSKVFDGAAGSAKEISRDMGTLMADFKHFGGISTKEIGQAVVYFRRLGLEVSKVMGVIEKYDNFEDAAKGAAHLSQAFNLNVDALEIMKAQNPAQRVEMLRKAFFQAGRTVENMTRQERALLAQQTGLDDSALDLAFSMKNQGLSYDQVTKKADVAKKKQLSQAEAMAKLADSIERLVKGGGVPGSGGFLDRFIQGFSVGIQRSHEFRKLMRDLRVDLISAWRAGVQVGRAFVNMFPGVKDVFQGLAALFEPKRFRAMFQKIVGSFKEFFKDMTENPKSALPKLFENLKKNFFSWFSTNGENGKKVLDGFKKFFIAMSDIAGGLLKLSIQGLTKSIQFITDLISGKQKLNAPGDQGAMGFIGRLLRPMIDAVVEAGPALWKAIKSMFLAVWKKIQPWIAENWLKVVSILLAPSTVGVAGRVIVTSITNAFAGGLLSWVKGGGVTKAFEGIKGTFTKQVTKVTEGMAKLPTPPQGTGKGAGLAATEAVQGASKTADAANNSKITAGSIGKMALIVAFVVVGMAALMYGIFKFAQAMQESNLGIPQVLAASAAMVATSVAMLGIAFSIKALSAININPGMLGKIAVGVAIVGGVGALMALGSLELIKMFGDIQTSKLTKTITVMGATGVFFLAAGGVVAIAAAVGTIALLGGGLGTLAIAAGLVSIAATIEIMKTQGLAIMKSVDAFKPGPGFVEKATVFVEIMKGVGSFTASVAQLVEATRPGILDFLRGAGANEQQETLRQVDNVIKTLGSQLVTIVNSVKDAVRSLGGTEQELKSAQILGSLLGGVSELANAMKPPAEALQDSGWIATLFGNGEQASRKIAAIQDFVMSVGYQLRQFTKMIAKLLTSELGQGITEEQRRAAEVIPSVLGGVAQFANALKSGSTTILQLAGSGKQEPVLRAVSNYMFNLIHNISSSQIFQRITETITGIVDSVRGLTSEQMKSVQTLAPIIGPAFQGVADIANIIGSLAVPQQGPTENNTQAIANLTELVKVFFDKIKTDLPSVVLGMRESFKNFSAAEIQNMSKGVEGLGKLFELISMIPKIFDNMKNISGVKGLNVATVEDLNYTMDNLFLLLYGSRPGQGLVNTLKELTGSLVSITSVIPPDFGEKIGGLKTVFDILGQVPGMIKNFTKVSGGGIVAGDIMNVPLANLINIVKGLGSDMTSQGPNPLIKGRLGKLLAGITGISNNQRNFITATVDKISEVTKSVTSLNPTVIQDKSEMITNAIANANANLYALAVQIAPGIEGNFLSNIKSMAPFVSESMKAIKQASFESVGSVVRDMVAEINSLTAELKSIKPIEIETSLDRLGDSLGLGANKTYTIEHRNFTITTNVVIKFDNNSLDAFELGILRRTGPRPTRIMHGDLTQ